MPPPPRSRMLRARLCILFGLVLVPPGMTGPASAAGHMDSGALEVAVKATYLYKFAPFVSWPDIAKGGPSDPLVLCIVGGDPFGSVIDRAVAGQRLGERRFAVRRPPSAADGAGCHILFVGYDEPADVAAVLRVMRGQPVLTVTDGQRVAPAKGIVNFVVVDGRVRFEIDIRAADESGIAISSKLLSLAVSGRDRN